MGRNSGKALRKHHNDQLYHAFRSRWSGHRQRNIFGWCKRDSSYPIVCLMNQCRYPVKHLRMCGVEKYIRVDNIVIEKLQNAVNAFIFDLFMTLYSKTKSLSTKLVLSHDTMNAKCYGGQDGSMPIWKSSLPMFRNIFCGMIIIIIQPNHHVPFLFNYSSCPWLTQKLTRKICDKAYSVRCSGIVRQTKMLEMSYGKYRPLMGIHPVVGNPHE